MTGQTGALCATHRLDFTELDEHSPDLPEARATCGRCPLLIPCRQYALKTANVSGVAGGMTEAERLAWRAQNHVHVTDVSIVDVTPGWSITPDIADALPVSDTGIPDVVVDLVLRMTKEGLPAEEIVARLNRPDVTHRTVKYLRHRYSKGPTRVEA